MNQKIQTAIKLIESGDDAKHFQGLCLLMEVYDQDPSQLDPVARCLINKSVRRLVKGVEESLGVPVFDGEAA
jgi:hypothetical protein